MGFNAGGTNVGGIQSVEAGQLKMERVTTEITADGTVYATVTVPAGHLYVFKAYSGYQAGGTFTVGTTSYLKDDGAGVIQISTAASATVSLPYTLNGGMGMKMRYVITGLSEAGEMVVDFLYQDITL